MKFRFAFLAALVVLACGRSTAQAQLYWDINGTNLGSSDGGVASGNWSSSSAFWNTDPTGGAGGTIGAWVPDSVAVFSAGGSDAYTVTLIDAESASGITFQDGPIGATLAASGAGQLTLTGAATVSTTSPTAESTISAPIAGTVGLNASGANVLILSGANTYSGTTTVAAGLKLKLGAANAVPSGSILSLASGNANTAFNMNGFDDTVKSLISAGATAANILIGTNTLTLADPQGESTNAIFSTSAGGKVVKNGTGSITLAGATGLFVGGEFVVNNGNVNIGNNNIFGTNANGSKLTMNGGSLTTTANLSMNTEKMDIGGSFAMNMNTTGNLQFFGGGNGPMVLKVDSPTITVNPDSTTARPVIPDPSNPTAQNGVFILGGIVQNDGATPRGITKAGNGILTLSNPDNSYSGDTTIQQGILRLSKQIGAEATTGDGKAGTGRIILSGAGATLTYNGSFNTTVDTSRTLTVANPVRVTADGVVSYISNTANLVPAMPGTLTDFHNIYFVFASSDISGTAGTLTLRNDGVCTSNSNSCVFRPTFTGSGFDFARPVAISNQINDATTGRVSTRSTVLHSSNTSGTQTWSGSISGDGSLIRSGAGGTTVLSGANTFAGGATVEGGTLAATGASATFGAGNVTVAGGNLQISSGVTNAILDTATLSLMGGGTAGVADVAYANLGAGINERVLSLLLGGASQASGTYGSTASSATFKLNEYFSGTGILTVGSIGVPGDYNGNGVVDGADYVVWRNGGPLQNEVATLGSVTAEDYTEWRARFGNTSGGGALQGSAVPEPMSALVVLLAGGLVFLTGRGRRHGTTA